MATDMATNYPHRVELGETVAEERGAVLALLEANRERREKAAAETHAAREELETLLLRGYATGLQVADMSRRAGVSRDLAHRTLKGAGEMSWKDKQAWASEVMAGIPGGTYERNEFRMFVNMLLMKALGRNPEGLPQSVRGIVDEATKTMREIANKPRFTPDYVNPAIFTYLWPGEPSPP